MDADEHIDYEYVTDLVAEIHRRAVLRSLTDEAWLDHRLRAYFGITAP